MAVQTFTKAGTKATTAAKLDKAIFDIEIKNHDLLKEAYVTHLANRRSAAAKTKKRGQVSGGGIKPWRQKGTGRARVGSIRSPIWRGGGITFGPTGDQNYTRSLPTVSKRQALRQALSMANQTGKLAVIESITADKTATVAKLMTKLGMNGSVLVVVDVRDDKLVRSINNIQGTQVRIATSLSVFDLLNANNVLMTEAALKAVSEWLKVAVKTASAKEAKL